MKNKRHVRIDFDARNKDLLMQTLTEQLSAGYKLQKSHPISGAMTFVPAESDIHYACVLSSEYPNGLPEPWKSCGRMSVYTIYSAEGEMPAVPEKEADYADYLKSGSRRSVAAAILWVSLFALHLYGDILSKLGNAASMADITLSDAAVTLVFGIEASLMIFSAAGAVKGQKRSLPSGNGTRSSAIHFKQFILPWIEVIALIGIIVGGLAFPLRPPKQTPPLSGELADYSIKRGVFADKYNGKNRFVYHAKSEKFAEKLFDCAVLNDDGGLWSDLPFFLLNGRISVPSDGYENIDEICRLSYDYTDVEIGSSYIGLIVRCGSDIYGMMFDTDEISEEDVLSALNKNMKG